MPFLTTLQFSSRLRRHRPIHQLQIAKQKLHEEICASYRYQAYQNSQILSSVTRTDGKCLNLNRKQSQKQHRLILCLYSSYAAAFRVGGGLEKLLA